MKNTMPENFNALSFLFGMTPHLPQRTPQFPLTSTSQNMMNLLPSLPGLSLQAQTMTPTMPSLSEFGQQDGFLSRIFQRNIQAEIVRAQMATLSQFETQNNQANAMQLAVNTPPVPEVQKVTESQVKNVLDFLLKNIGQASQAELDAERQKCGDNETLKQIFDHLVQKYTSITKTKEEMVKYVFRKALKSIKDQIKGGSKRNDKHVNKLFFQKYFKNSKDDLVKKESNIEEEDLLEFLLPFKKKSANKTMNSKFLSKIFASDEFATAFEEYLNEFESEADYDNRVKIKKFVSYILACVKGNKVQDILECKRVPWLKSWIANAKRIGYQLRHDKEIGKKKKKVKQNNNSSYVEESSDSECKAEAVSTPESD